jgi:putative sigma-54 modulation protein
VDVRVHGKNMSLREDIAELATDKVGRASRFFDGAFSADVEFEARNNPRNSDGRVAVEITGLAAGQMVRVVASANDDRSALDSAVDKFERRLRKLKERLIQRTRTDDHKLLNLQAGSSDEDTEDAPQIVRTKRFAMHPMTPEEAALQMEMIGHDFFFFLDAETGRHCVLYHRKDGQLGLIEPA